jgi:hypothetical protein
MRQDDTSRARLKRLKDYFLKKKKRISLVNVEKYEVVDRGNKRLEYSFILVIGNGRRKIVVEVERVRILRQIIDHVR